MKKGGGGEPIKFLQVFDISMGKKHFFFKKCPNNGLVSEKKYIVFFHSRGGGQSDQSVKNFLDFFFNEGFPHNKIVWK